MQTYEKMLENVYQNLPEKQKKKERLEVPNFTSFVEGRTTIIKNFKQVADTLRRNPQHMVKYMTRELGTPINLDGKRAIAKSRIRRSQLDSALDGYVKEYVICNECGKLDTKLTTFEGVKYKRCEACGARAPVKPL